MSGLLNLHRIAAARGDGLLPELAELFAARAAHEAANIVELGAVSGQVQGGPMPRGRAPEFLPGKTPRRNECRSAACRKSPCG